MIKTKEKGKLIRGRMMTCPRCEKSKDILAFTPLRMIERYSEETTPIYKCPDCRWIFAPADNLIRQLLMANVEEKVAA